MIYITGDTHNDFTRFDIDKIPIQNKMTKNERMLLDKLSSMEFKEYRKAFLNKDWSEFDNVK